MRLASSTTSHSKASVSMLPWDLRMRSQKDIRTEGLFAALNDCLYRSMYRYVCVASRKAKNFMYPSNEPERSHELFDIHSQISIRGAHWSGRIHHSTLQRHTQRPAYVSVLAPNRLLQINDCKLSIDRFLNSRWQSLRMNGRNTGAYSFQNAFFYLQFGDDPKTFATEDTSNAALRAALITQKKTRRYLTRRRRINSTLQHTIHSFPSVCWMFQTSEIASTKTTIEIHLQTGSGRWGWQSFCMGIYNRTRFTQCAGRCWHSSSLSSKCTRNRLFSKCFSHTLCLLFRRCASSAETTASKHRRWWIGWRTSIPNDSFIVSKMSTISWKCRAI